MYAIMYRVKCNGLQTRPSYIFSCYNGMYVMKLCLPICVHVAVSLTICICPGLRASVHAMMLCACVVCLVFIFVCRLFTITSDACACACGLRAYHYLLAALLIIT